jgi:hypothetical protein
MKRMDKKLFLKSVVRTAVDGCFLPGTMMGTELMILWLVKTSREVSTISLAVLSIFFSNYDFQSSTSPASSRQSSEQEG